MPDSPSVVNLQCKHQYKYHEIFIWHKSEPEGYKAVMRALSGLEIHWCQDCSKDFHKHLRRLFK